MVKERLKKSLKKRLVSFPSMNPSHHETRRARLQITIAHYKPPKVTCNEYKMEVYEIESLVKTRN